MRTLILQVEDDKHDGLVEALKKRPSIHIVSLDREGRKKFRDCPCCNRRLARESSFTINEPFVECLTTIAGKMSIAKTVILVFEGMSFATIPPVEQERCAVVDETMAVRAETLGLIKPFLDGARKTHFVTAAGIEFLRGEKPASPSTIVTLEGEVVETSGEILLDNVKFKDTIRGEDAKRRARDAVKRIPESVMNFVINGQMSLI